MEPHCRFGQIALFAASVCVCARLTGPQCVLVEPCHPLPQWGEMLFTARCLSFPCSSGCMSIQVGQQAENIETLKLWSVCVCVWSMFSRRSCVRAVFAAVWFSTSRVYPKAETSLQASFLYPTLPLPGFLPPAAAFTGLEVPPLPFLCLCGCALPRVIGWRRRERYLRFISAQPESLFFFFIFKWRRQQQEFLSCTT